MSWVSAHEVNGFLRQMLQRLVEAERRIAGTEVRGKVKQVDTTKARARIVIGKDSDGEDVLSPWLPYKQIAADLKIHIPPTVGQTMAIRSASGDLEQGSLEPFHWSDENPANSTAAAENVLTFGDVTVTLKKSGLFLSIGGTTYQFTASGYDQEGGHHRHDGKNTGSDHVHGGVIQGDDDTTGPH
jgi:hypothetical protein